MRTTTYRLGGTVVKKSTCQCRRLRRCRFDPSIGKIFLRRKWQPTPVFLPEKEESGGLQFMKSIRVRFNCATEHAHISGALWWTNDEISVKCLTGCPAQYIAASYPLFLHFSYFLPKEGKEQDQEHLLCWTVAPALAQPSPLTPALPSRRSSPPPPRHFVFCLWWHLENICFFLRLWWFSSFFQR